MAERRWWLLPTVICAAALALSLVFWCGDLDLTVARWLVAVNQAHGGTLPESWAWRTAYYLPGVIAGLLVAGACVGMVVGAVQPARRAWLRAGLFLVLCLGIGPGLLANALLKDHWGRPRPRETVSVGPTGTWAYLRPWEKGVGGQGKSFPCGHATVPAVAGMALWLLWRRRRERLALACLVGGAAATAYVGAARMLVGGHWLSDVVWAAALMGMVACVLHRLVVQGPDAGAGPASPRRRWMTGIALGLVAVGIAAGILLATPYYSDRQAAFGPDELGNGPWRLVLSVETGDVSVTLRPDAGRPLSFRGEHQGFGMPDSRVDHVFEVHDGIADLRLRNVGRFTEQSSYVQIAIDPARLSRLEISVGRGDIRVEAAPGTAPVPVSAVSGRGEVRLPAGWTRP